MSTMTTMTTTMTPMTTMEDLLEKFVESYKEEVEEIVEEMRDDYQGSWTYKISIALEESDKEAREKSPLPTIETFKCLTPFFSGKKVEFVYFQKIDHGFFQEAVEDLAESFASKDLSKGLRNIHGVDVVLIQYTFSLDATTASDEIQYLEERGGSCLIYAGEAIENLPAGWKLAYTGKSLVLPMWDISSQDDDEQVILEWKKPTEEWDSTWRVYTRV